MPLEVTRSTIGTAEIIQIVELEIGSSLAWLIPETTPENVSRISWLKLPYANADHSLNALSQSFIVRLGSRTLVVDTCIGNDKTIPEIAAWNAMQLDFLETLERAGIDRMQVTDVLCTHLHVDHVGWNTHRKDGEWLPTFPNARYHFARAEHEFWRSNEADALHAISFRESVQPIFDAGLANLIDAPGDLGDGISVIPTPGHTHGHVAVVIDAGSRRFIIAGDAFHHPCQIARPEWATVGDHDKVQSTETRRTLLSELAGTPTLIAGIHFSIPSFGRIVETGDGHAFEP